MSRKRRWNPDESLDEDDLLEQDAEQSVDFGSDDDGVSVVMSDVVDTRSSPVDFAFGDDAITLAISDDENSRQFLNGSQVHAEDESCSHFPQGSPQAHSDDTMEAYENPIVPDTSFEIAEEALNLNDSKLSGIDSADVDDDQWGTTDEVNTQATSASRDSNQLNDSFLKGIECDTSDTDSDSDLDYDDALSLHSDDDDILSGDEYCDDSTSYSDATPLYKEAPITVNGSLLAVLTYAMRHNLSGKAIVDLLKLLYIHCRKEDCRLRSTLYFFKKHFSHLKAPVKLHYFCSVCFTPLDGPESTCKKIGKHKRKKTQCSFFLEISLEHQVKVLFKRKGFAEDLQHRFSHTKVSPQNIEDIYDGQLHKEFVENGFLSANKPFNFSMTANSDSVPVFKSSRTSMTPVYFAINELPFKKRFKKENVLLGGIWYGSKPLYNLMLKPYLETFKNLRRGISVELYGSDEKVQTQGILLNACADLPAKADLMGIKHPSGSFSCATCKIEGMSVKTEAEIGETEETEEPQLNEDEEALLDDPDPPTHKKQKKDKPNRKKRVGSVWVFPYSDEVELRRHEEIIRNGDEAWKRRIETNDEKSHVNGAKWPTYLSKIMPDMIRGMGIDDLHHSYHGVGRRMLELWTLPKYKSKPWSIYGKLSVVDDRLKKVCLPNFVQCGIRSITNLALWKGLHIKIFILYLALPILAGILPQEYLDHFACYVHCLYILNSSSISPDSLLFCENALKKFVKQFQVLYGVRFMTINVHNTLHLPFVVNNLGPMRCYSCFPFESLNGEMLRMIHGTRFVQMQLANCAYILISLPYEIEAFKSKVLIEFASQLHHSYQRVKILETISKSTFVAGNWLKTANLSSNVRAALQEFNVKIDSCKVFSKLKRGSTLFVSQSYARVTKTASYLVSYSYKSQKCYGVVCNFIRTECQSNCVNECSCEPMFLAAIKPAVTRKFSDAGTYCKKIGHILRYILQEEIQLIPIDQLLHICFSVSVNGRDPFLCERMNLLELE